MNLQFGHFDVDLHLGGGLDILFVIAIHFRSQQTGLDGRRLLPVPVSPLIHLVQELLDPHAIRGVLVLRQLQVYHLEHFKLLIRLEVICERDVPQLVPALGCQAERLRADGVAVLEAKVHDGADIEPPAKFGAADQAEYRAIHSRFAVIPIIGFGYIGLRFRFVPIDSRIFVMAILRLQTFKFIPMPRRRFSLNNLILVSKRSMVRKRGFSFQDNHLPAMIIITVFFFVLDRAFVIAVFRFLLFLILCRIIAFVSGFLNDSLLPDRAIR